MSRKHRCNYGAQLEKMVASESVAARSIWLEASMPSLWYSPPLRPGPKPPIDHRSRRRATFPKAAVQAPCGGTVVGMAALLDLEIVRCAKNSRQSVTSIRHIPDSMLRCSALERARRNDAICGFCSDMNIYSGAQLSALTRLFSATVFREMAKKGRSGLFRRLLQQTDLIGRTDPRATVGDTFDSAFEVLKIMGHRDEYIYRAAISQKVLMGTHSLRTASMLNEFRAGSSKADLVILNGTATVYEIKSERDSLARLAKQIENYKRVFAKVNVIASEGHIEGVLAAVSDDVGIMCLTKRYQITTLREAVDCPARICPVTVFESLRVAEAVTILRAMGVTVPKVPNTQRHAVMRDLFAMLDPVALHVEMVRTLKRTRDLAPLGELVERLPKSLQAAALSVSVRRTDHSRLVNAIETPLNAAMAWS